MPKIFTRYDRPKKLDYVQGDSLLDKSGYYPAKKRIENMILAGQRLTVQRDKEMYDFEKDLTEYELNYEDPTRSSNFDMADASMIANYTKAQKARIVREQIRAKALQSASKASGGVKKEPEGVTPPAKEKTPE